MTKSAPVSPLITGTPNSGDGAPGEPDKAERPQRVRIRLADGKERTFQHISSTMFYSAEGRPLSAQEFIQRLFGDLPRLFKHEDELRRLWGDPTTRQALLASLNERGYSTEALNEMRRMIDADKSDLYDVLACVAFALPTITRLERVRAGRTGILSPYDSQIQSFLDFVLSKYIDDDVQELDQAKLADLLVLKYHGLNDGVAALGGDLKCIREAFVGFQPHLYKHVSSDSVPWL